MTAKLGTLAKVTTWIAIAMSSYHLYTGAFGAPEALLHRSIHLMFTMVLIFLLYPFSKEKGAYIHRLGDFVFLGEHKHREIKTPFGTPRRWGHLAFCHSGAHPTCCRLRTQPVAGEQE